MIVEQASRDELPEALTVLYDVAPQDRQAYLAHAFRLMARGELDPSDFWLAREQGALVGVLALREVPGNAGVVWPPRTANPNQPEVEDRLLVSAIAQIPNVRLLQSFLPPEQESLAAPLLRNGFQHTTNIIHLEHPGGVMAPPIAHFDLTTAPDVHSPAFRRLLIRCHDDSLDCPELHARRHPDDVLKGYLDTAPEPHGWCVATWHGEPVGVAITSPGELSFMGLIPEARGQGLGHVFLGQILDRMAGVCRLIVDERNIAARRMYDRAGFRPTGIRLVYLWFADEV